MTKVLTLGLLLTHCAYSQPPIEPVAGADCHQMCEHLDRLGCEEGLDTPGGATCEQVCESTLQAGLDLHPECVLGVSDCTDVSRASQGCI